MSYIHALTFHALFSIRIRLILNCTSVNKLYNCAYFAASLSKSGFYFFKFLVGYGPDHFNLDLL